MRRQFVIFVLIVICSVLSLAGSSKPGTGGTNWSGGSAISPVCQPDPTRGSQLNDVAVNANGQAIAAWDQYTYNAGGGATIGANIQSGGKWGSAFTISGSTGFSITPRVAIGAEGTMVVSWTYQDSATSNSPQQKIQVAIKAANSSSWTTSTLATGPLGGVSVTESVPVGVDANGNVIAAWTIWDGSHNMIQAARKPAGGAWTAPINIAPTVDGIYPALAVNARGDAMVVYSVTPFAGTNMPNHAEFAFRNAAGTGPNGGWTLPLDVSEVISSSSGYVSNPIVALDANGLGAVVYMGFGIEGTRQLANGSWTTPQTIIQAPNRVSSYTSFDLALDQNGNSVVAASIFDATINVDRASIWVTRGSAAGTWNLQQRITDPTVPVDAYAVRAAISADGTLAMVGWIDHYHGAVQMSKFANGAWSAANTIGKGTAFSSFQETLGLRIASANVARAIWKNAKTGTQTMAATYGH